LCFRYLGGGSLQQTLLSRQLPALAGLDDSDVLFGALRHLQSQMHQRSVIPRPPEIPEFAREGDGLGVRPE
jgi:hypothetical protein